MRDSLLIIGCLVGLLLGASQLGRAQYILAGQTVGATYTGLALTKTLHVQLQYPSAVNYVASDSLDLNADGRFDLRFSIFGNTPSGPGTSWAFWGTLKVLHSNVNALTHSEVSTVKNLSYGDTIQVKTFNTPTPHPFIWTSNPTRDYMLCSASSISSAANYGLWMDGQDGYLAFRIRPNSLGQWRYGWVRMQALPVQYNVIKYGYMDIIIKDYALTTGILNGRAAMAAGWQIYPTLVADHIQVQSPLATTGNLTITDACGRLLQHAQLAAAGQQLNLSALAPGLYFLHVQTATGSFVQRLVKQ